MFDLTDGDVKELVKSYKKKIIKSQDVLSDVRIGTYEVDYLVECGLKYIYGEEHYVDGNIVDCKTSFKKNLKKQIAHTCKMDFVTVERAELPVKGMAICSAWSEKNLALITSENKCHAFFKNHFLFDFSASNATALDASSKFIVLGTNTGTIIQYDPVLKARNANNKHSKSVTAVHCYQDTVLSASEDGSYSLGNNKVDVTPSGIVDALLMPDGSVVCACGDNSVVVSKNNAFTTYLGHKDKIINLSHNKSTITSSVDGFFGILRNELNMVNMECSKHEQRNSSLVLGYGMTKLRHFDLNSGKIIDLYEENNTILNKPQINCATVEGDLIAFTTGNGSTINFLDPRSDDKMCYEIGQPIIDLKFSNTSDLLYVATETSSIMCNVKRITM